MITLQTEQVLLERRMVKKEKKMKGAEQRMVNSSWSSGVKPAITGYFNTQSTPLEARF